MTTVAATEPSSVQRQRVSIGFINFAHALDHYAMLILATAVIELAVVYDWTYAQLIALGTPSFIAFGVFSLPAGWLADRWSRRNMMALFYLGCGGALAAAGFAPSLAALAVSYGAPATAAVEDRADFAWMGWTEWLREYPRISGQMVR